MNLPLFSDITMASVAKEPTRKSSRKKKTVKFLQYDHLLAADKIRKSRKRKERQRRKKESDKKRWARKKKSC